MGKPDIRYLTMRRLVILIVLHTLISYCTAKNEGSTKKRIAFGEANPPSTHVPVIEAEQSISCKKFFLDYVEPQQVVLFRGAIKHSRAFTHWTDDYFLSLKDIPTDHMVLVEHGKKENRDSPAESMSFQEFVRIYNHTDQYMVNGVPPFLRQDYILPHHLQCDQLMNDIIVERFMWFSSGGTSSVVHTDDVENLNCLVAGTKRFTFVPSEYKDMVTIDHPERAYSGVDVDDVDYDKYPDMANIKFMHADMQPGDCLYIPYKLIHQVRSYDRNIAVNIWWNKNKNGDLDLDKCDAEFDPEWSLERVHLTGFNKLHSSPELIRAHIEPIIIDGGGALTFEEFYPRLGLRLLMDEDFKKDEPELYQEVLDMLIEGFSIIDADKDGKISTAELKSMDNDDWNTVAAIFEELGELDNQADEGEDDSEIPQQEDNSETTKHATDEL